MSDLDEKILRLDAKWRIQGRTEEQKWAVRNFLTGHGAIAIKELIAEEVRKAAK